MLLKTIVKKEAKLLQFLYENLKNRSRNSIKSILRRGQVLVNDEKQTKHNFILQPNDEIKVLSFVIADDVKLHGLEIIDEDNDLIIINKRNGLLSVQRDRSNEPSAYGQLNHYVKQIHPKRRIYLVHRLDRDTSGLMLFAKNKKTQQFLQNNWYEMMKERSYIALVEGEVKQDGTITSYLKETKNNTMISSKENNGGKKAITHYKVLQSSKHYSLLKIFLKTGRKNQIRVHMQHIGHSIAGDKKYGAKTNPVKRLALHAETLRFIHPRKKDIVTYRKEAPRSFNKYVK